MCKHSSKRNHSNLKTRPAYDRNDTETHSHTASRRPRNLYTAI